MGNRQRFGLCHPSYLCALVRVPRNKKIGLGETVPYLGSRPHEPTLKSQTKPKFDT